MKKIAGTALFLVGIGIIIVIGFVLIGLPIIQPYQFVTFAKVSGVYDEPFYMKFFWDTENELQIGKPVRLSAELRGLPYINASEAPKEIILRFNESELNYLHVDEDVLGDRVYEIDYLSFKPNWENHVFEADEIGIRFIVPVDISAQYCDYNIGNECTKIENIIHPAPHDLAIQIQNNQIGIAVSLVIAGFSCVIVWTNFSRRLS